MSILDLRPEQKSSAVKDSIERHLVLGLGKSLKEATLQDWYRATALTARDVVTRRWLNVRPSNKELGKKRVYYLSIEFLIGRLLFSVLTSLDLVDEVREALADFGVSLDDVRKVEPDAALGNGGLGRLAACYLDSMTSVGIPAYGYGIRYEHGLFAQRFRDGWQEEYPELWLKTGNPWELTRPEKEYEIGFGGSVEGAEDNPENPGPAVWTPTDTVIATTHDVPVIGWRGEHANILRLWGARPIDPIRLSAFNEGDYVGAMSAKIQAEAITRILYPNDHTPQGQELRLRQEYFFTAASLADIVRRHMEQVGDIRKLSAFAAIQLNDTHPAIAVAELMRILVDLHGLSWHEAWTITRETISFTNHTLLPEALEKWPVALFGRILPRHLQIIYLINWHHLKNARTKDFADDGFLFRISLIDESGDKAVRMAHLAYVGSHHVNGVSQLHTELLKETVFQDLAKVAPTVIVNKTNGIAFRRWLHEANPALAKLIADTIGDAFMSDPTRLLDLERYATDASFVAQFEKIRQQNKTALAKVVREASNVQLDASALFDVQIKRIHEYKRQCLNLLEAIACYLDIKDEPHRDVLPRVKILSGKAAPGYARAKLIIKLANDIARVVNNDPAVGDKLKVVFVPNYNVSLAEVLIPAADLSEQISTAGMEASGTGNMKLALNGALTIGTLDGANIEIRERVGAENFFLFGMTADQVAEKKQDRVPGGDAVQHSQRLQRVIEALSSGLFSPDDDSRYHPLIADLLVFDPYMTCLDFEDYWRAQREVDAHRRNPAAWWKASILNTARMAWFSSDRAVREYADDIWRIPLSHPGNDR